MFYEYQISVCIFEKISCKFEPYARLVESIQLYKVLSINGEVIKCFLESMTVHKINKEVGTL